MTIFQVQEKTLKVKETNVRESLGGEDIDVSIYNHLLDEIKAKLSSDTEIQEMGNFNNCVKEIQLHWLNSELIGRQRKRLFRAQILRKS